MTDHDSDRIEKQIRLAAPPSRVWRALTDAEEFGSWFRVKLEGRIEPNARLSGSITYPGYEHVRFDATIVHMEHERLLAWRWPHLIDDGPEVTDETTLVTFSLQAVPEGTLLTVTESGFEALPANVRGKSYRGNEEGWQIQMQNIEEFLSA